VQELNRLHPTEFRLGEAMGVSIDEPVSRIVAPKPGVWTFNNIPCGPSCFRGEKITIHDVKAFSADAVDPGVDLPHLPVAQ
jgi:hypothetical protein